MKFISSVILTALLGNAAPLFFAWWTFSITSFVVALVVLQKPRWAFLSAFLGMFFLWLIQAWMLDNANDHILSIKVANLFSLNGSYLALLLLTAFLGGLISGFAGLSGSLLSNINRYR